MDSPTNRPFYTHASHPPYPLPPHTNTHKHSYLKLLEPSERTLARLEERRPWSSLVAQPGFIPHTQARGPGMGAAASSSINDGAAAGRIGVVTIGGMTIGGGATTVTVAVTVGEVTPPPDAEAVFTIEPAVMSAAVTV